MTIREAIHTDLHDYAALTSIVSTRIYEIEAEPGDMDNFVVWMKIDDPRINNTNVCLPIRKARFQFSCYSTGKFQVRTIADLIIEQYKDYSGNLASGVKVHRARVIDDRDQGREGDFFRVDVDISFQYEES